MGKSVTRTAYPELPFVPFALLAFAATIALAVTSYELFEKRILALKDVYFPHSDRKPRPPSDGAGG